MTEITTPGLDLGKRVFQVHGGDGAGKTVLRQKRQRGQMARFFADLAPCLVGLDACASAHYWARLIATPGHKVRLIPPAYVMPHVRRSKTEAADAAAICEAVARPSMRFVPIKSAGQQAALSQHRVRDLLVRQRTMLINALRGHLGEFGIIGPVGRHHAAELERALAVADEVTVPALAREALQILIAERHSLDQRLKAIEVAIVRENKTRENKTNAVSRRLTTIPGIGPITASAIAATIPDPAALKLGREFAAWIGLVPRPHCSGGKRRPAGESTGWVADQRGAIDSYVGCRQSVQRLSCAISPASWIAFRSGCGSCWTVALSGLFLRHRPASSPGSPGPS